MTVTEYYVCFQSAIISEDDAAEFKKQVYDQIELLEGVEYALLGLGGFLILVATVTFIVLCVRSRRNKDEKVQSYLSDI